VTAYRELIKKVAERSADSGRTVPPLVLAVSKFQDFSKIRSLYEEGHRDFGENYVQELIEKAKKAQTENLEGIRFHFIGQLQSNKVKTLLPWVSSIHSVGTIKLLLEIEKRAAEIRRRIPIFFQINIDEEPQKGGFYESDLTALREMVSRCVYCIPMGLMCIPNPERSPTGAFQRMQGLQKRHQNLLGPGLSMGMSSDYLEAIAAGSTVVRVGTALFGARNVPGA
jgi:pyridoxal phosphate enzyme (YggS family)